MKSGPSPNSPVRPGATFANAGTLGAAGSIAVVAPGANVNGVIVWGCGYVCGTGGNSTGSVIAKTSAPASAVDGDVLLSLSTTATAVGGARRQAPRFVAAGKGVYFFSTLAEVLSLKDMDYTIL